MDQLRVEPLQRRHVRDSFCSGEPSLDGFIQLLATQYERRRLGKTWVGVIGDDPKVVGYYTLAASAVAFENFSPQVTQKLPRHPVPTILLARLAVDRLVQKRGFGKLLLQHALKTCGELEKSLGVFAVEVEAISEDARSFYGNFGFESLVSNTLHLYLPISTIQKARNRSSG